MASSSHLLVLILQSFLFRRQNILVSVSSVYMLYFWRFVVHVDGGGGS
jgi:hypothetical protein